MMSELAPGVGATCLIVAGLFFVIGSRTGLRLNHPRFFFVGFFAFVGFGLLMFVPESLIGVELKWALLFVTVAFLVLSPAARNIYLHWTHQAELKAQELAAIGRHAAAIRLLESARAEREPSLMLLNLLAFCLHATGRYEEALETVEEAEERFGLSSELTIKKAFCLARLGERKEALALFTPMLDELPNDFNLIFQYASLLLQMGMRDEGEQQYERAEVLFLRESSEERKQEWRPKLNKMRSVLRGGVSR